jgi:signal transduction histidine kinase
MPKEKLDIVLSVLLASLFVLLLMVAVFMLFRIYLKRKNKLILERERMAIEFEQTLLQSKLEIQEATFTYISRELHDNVGQALSLVSINLNTLNAPNQDEKLRMMDDILGKAMTDLRNLSHSLDADYIRKNGWTEPVMKLLDQLNRTGRYTTEITIDEELPALGSDRPIILFRMIQEIINNIIKHAAADKIIFAAKNNRDKLVITICDNGKGFDRESIPEGAGLSNLEKRSKMIHADFLIDSAPANGTKVTISIKPGLID